MCLGIGTCAPSEARERHAHALGREPPPQQRAAGAARRLRERGAHLAVGQALQEVGFAAAVLAQEAVSAQGGSRGVRAAARGAPASGPRMRPAARERRASVA